MFLGLPEKMPFGVKWWVDPDKHIAKVIQGHGWKAERVGADIWVNVGAIITAEEPFLVWAILSLYLHSWVG